MSIISVKYVISNLNNNAFLPDIFLAWQRIMIGTCSYLDTHSSLIQTLLFTHARQFWYLQFVPFLRDRQFVRYISFSGDLFWHIHPLLHHNIFLSSIFLHSFFSHQTLNLNHMIRISKPHQHIRV